jgi:hypothetical protein
VQCVLSHLLFRSAFAVASTGSVSSDVGTVFPPVVNGSAVVPVNRNASVLIDTLVTGDMVLDGTLTIGNLISLTVQGTCYISGTLDVLPVGYLRCQGLLVLRATSRLIVQANATGRLVPVVFRSLQGLFFNISAATPQICANAFLTSNASYTTIPNNGGLGSVSVPVTVQFQVSCYYGWVTGAVIGIIIGGLLLIALLVLLALFCHKRKKVFLFIDALFFSRFVFQGQTDWRCTAG